MKLTTEEFDSICKRVVPKLCEQLFYKRKELYNQKQLYHYTNLNAFIGGIVCDGREINKEMEFSCDIPEHFLKVLKSIEYTKI